MALDGFSAVAVTTMISLAIVDLHVELVGRRGRLDRRLVVAA